MFVLLRFFMQLTLFGNPFRQKIRWPTQWRNSLPLNSVAWLFPNLLSWECQRLVPFVSRDFFSQFQCKF
jgi:hypothetical protein